MNRPRESLLTLFDPLFSGDPMTPPPCRDVPSPDLGSDKENAPPANDSPITLTKFFNRIYTRPKAQQQPRPLPKGRLVDVGDASASYDNNDNDESDSDSDSDDVVRSEHVFVVHPRAPLPTSRDEERGEEDEPVHDASPRRPLADIAFGDSRSRGSSPIAVKRALSSSPSPFGSPSPFKLTRPTPAPSSSPLASVINTINGATSPSPSRAPPLTPSALRIAVTPAEPSSPSPTRRQLRPGAMLHASPGADARRKSVDLQASLSVHFDESSFDLLKDKISLPENDSLGELDMDMRVLTLKAHERTGHGVENVMMPSADSESDSDTELDCAGLLEERLRDMKIGEEAVQQNNDEDGRGGISTPPPVQPSGCNLPTPQAPVRQFVRPGNKKHVPSASLSSTAPPAPLPRRGARASISGLPMLSSVSTAALRISKKATKPETAPAPAPVAAPLPGRKTTGSTAVPRSAPAPPLQSPPRRGIELRGVQRPPAPTKIVAPSAAASVRVQSQRNKPITTQASSKAPVAAGAGVGLRPSGLRPPTSRAGVSGITMPRRVSVGGGVMRPSMAVGAGAGGVSAVRFGGSGATKMGLVKGDVASSLASARMMRRA